MHMKHYFVWSPISPSGFGFAPENEQVLLLAHKLLFCLFEVYIIHFSTVLPSKQYLTYVGECYCGQTKL